jgi:hypothetical protein
MLAFILKNLPSLCRVTWIQTQFHQSLYKGLTLAHHVYEGVVTSLTYTYCITISSHIHDRVTYNDVSQTPLACQLKSGANWSM